MISAICFLNTIYLCFTGQLPDQKTPIIQKVEKGEKCPKLNMFLMPLEIFLAFPQQPGDNYRAH